MEDLISIPDLEGLSVRRYKNASDFEAMSNVCGRSSLADGFEWTRSRGDIEGTYDEISTRDRFNDLIFAESGPEIVGYGESYAEPVDSSTWSFWNFAHVLPEWRAQGLREKIFRYNDRRLLGIARRTGSKGYFQTWACTEPNDWRDIIERNGFVRTFDVLEMENPTPAAATIQPLPQGLEIRPVPLGRCRDVWEGMREAYRNEPWFTETMYDEDHFRAWQTKSEFQPELWQVAWDGDRIVGVVQNHIDRTANETFRRSIGHTEDIYVAADWRHKGVASALISRSLRLLASLGMTEASLDVDVENASGALRLYEALGYRQVRSFSFYRKNLPPE